MPYDSYSNYEPDKNGLPSKAYLKILFFWIGMSEKS